MRILCGTDFSERAEEAATLGALLAERTGGDLCLVHVLDTRNVLLGPAAVLDALEDAARERLDALNLKLRNIGARVGTALPAGWPDEALIAEARRHGSALIVLPALGRRDGAGVRLGKTCERVLRRTEVPMLVLRDAVPLIGWLRGDRPLRVLIAYDFTPHAEAALLFAARLPELGACQMIAAYVDDPRSEARRSGLLAASEPTQQHLRDDIAQRLARALPTVTVDVVVAAHEGDPAARLAHLAEREQADLIVTGSHQRGAVERLFTGSVALELLRDSATNVLVVPGTVTTPSAEPLPQIRRVLAATDLSPVGDRAAAHALALTPRDGELVVVHVASPQLMRGGRYGRSSYAGFAAEHRLALDERRLALESILPVDAFESRSVRFELVEAERPAWAILEAIEREGADLVCLGSSGRSGAGTALLGSTAQAVIRGCRRPLLLVQPRER